MGQKVKIVHFESNQMLCKKFTNNKKIMKKIVSKSKQNNFGASLFDLSVIGDVSSMMRALNW